jgi:hypothetical protein
LKELQMTHRDEWKPGQRATFTYSFAPDPASDISARLAHRTGQVVEVLSEEDADKVRPEMPTLTERMDAGMPICYRVRFPDGHEDSAFEDELTEAG